MTNKAHKRFWKSFNQLPPRIQKLAREKFALWKREPFAPSFKFEERRGGMCVVRVGDHYRAVGIRTENLVTWFWIGTHEEYNGFRF